MVWFQCEDCGENMKKPKLQRHFNMCTATKLSCIDCGNMFGQDSVQWHTQCMTETEKYGPKRQSKPYNDLPANPPNSIQELDFDLNVGLSNQYPWYCSLCDVKATSEQSLVSHAVGNKHRVNVERVDDKQEQRQSEHVTVVEKKESSREQIRADLNVGLSNHYPWFCSLCNTKATSQQTLLSHANGRKHRQNVEWFNANQLPESGQSALDKKDQFEKDTVDSQQKKVDLHVSSGVGNGYSQSDKKRKMETFDETWKGEVLQAEEAEVGGEKKSKSKKAKKQDHEKKGKKKQTESDSDFEYDKEDMKLLLVSYSKEELVNLVYKTAEKGSRLMSTILESADREISQCNIFVRGFGWDTKQEHLKAAFESYGEIEECSMVMDKDTGRSKGYGFVLFKTRKGARKALKNPEKRMYNRTVVCNLASAKPCGAGKAHDMVEPMKIDLIQRANQSDVALPGTELAHRHVLEQRHQQPTMEMFRQNMPFYGHSQLPGFDPMYGVLTGNHMVDSLPNYYMYGSGLMNQGSVVPSNYMGMARQYHGDVEHTRYLR